MSAPTYVTAFVLVADIIIVSALVGGLNLALARAGWESPQRIRYVTGATIVLLGWFVIALSLAYSGVFRGTADRAPTIQYAILVPIVIGVACLWWSQTLSSILDSMPQQWLIGVQLYRALGIIFIILLSVGLLPPQFALPAGWGDITVGLLAPIIGLAYARGRNGSAFAAWAWNIFGLLDLLIAVGTGVLTSPSPFQTLSLEAPNELISAFPLVMVPAFAVPLSVLLHVASLVKLARVARDRQHRRAVTA